MSLDKIHNELLDCVNVIYMATHDTPKQINNFILSITGSGRPFINSFMKIYGYTAGADYTNIMIEIAGFSKARSYQISDEDYYKAIKLGLIPDGKEELVQTVEVNE